jgi:hypothetical protein
LVPSTAGFRRVDLRCVRFDNMFSLPQSELEEDIGDNTFVFSLNIPGIQSQKATCVELRAWEHEPSPAEDCWFELEHLEDFESTILEHFPSVRCISPDARTEAAATDYHLHSVVPRNDISDGPVHEPERKRRRLDTSSLYTAIPQVCNGSLFHSSSSLTCSVDSLTTILHLTMMFDSQVVVFHPTGRSALCLFRLTRFPPRKNI